METAFQLSPLRNRWLFLGILALFAIMAAIIYIPFLQPLFGSSVRGVEESAGKEADSGPNS